ncbi:MAG: C40 family peptidase [Bryobacteraceae bacterium]|nr:C40 family peptidase [Bryobacteraceae bacterium]
MNVPDFPAIVTGLLCLSLAAVAAAPPRQAVVTRPVADMLSKPSKDADVVSQAICTTTVDLLAKHGAWVQVRTPDDYTGWVDKKAVRNLGAGSYPASQKVAQIESLRAHIYREPSVTKHAPLLTVPFEARLDVLREGAGSEKPGDEDRWIQVRLPDGAPGWVQHGDVSLAPRTRDIPELVEFSRLFLGLPYTWGGASSFGYDCSGFTQMLCRRGGVNIPRDAQPQADWSGMTKVTRTELQPGDLLYFGASADKITHTGFYLGGGQFIHATTNTHPVIQIGRLDDAPWTNLLVACRRWKK